MSFKNTIKKILKKTANTFSYYIDNRHIFFVLGIKLRIKHKATFELKELKDFGLNREERKTKITVSLASFKERINYVHVTIQTLLMQKTKPDRVVLWLAIDQFPNKEQDLPLPLLRLKDFGLTIAWCEDLMPYKKLVPSLEKYPEDIIITTDDDMYYEDDVVEKLYDAYKKDPTQIYAHRTWRLIFKENAVNIMKKKAMYKDWKSLQEGSFHNYQLGYGGVLYPPKSLHKDVFNKELFQRILPTQDDIYFWAMALKMGTKIAEVKGYSFHTVPVGNTQETGLCKINNKKGIGTSSLEAIEIMLRQYPELKELLDKEYENE